ncbi:MAG: S-ribosylhomocysteine lyase [Bacillota bacterium]
MGTDIKVESFELDHTKVEAPYVRKAGNLTTHSGDLIEKYDLRLMQPNEETIPTAALHTIEHLLAGFMRERIDGVIDISPMGCRTGFYLIKLGQSNLEDIKQSLISSLEEVIATEEVPAMTAKQCGNYRDHSLFGAKEYAKEVLRGLQSN